MMRIWIFAVALSASGCSTFNHGLRIFDSPGPVAPKEAPAPLRKALVDLQAGRDAESVAVLDQFLHREPASPWTQFASFHRARGLEDLGRWSEAADQYRNVAAATEARAPLLQARALYRLSFCHEALGEDQQTLAVLHDLYSRSMNLPPEISSAELPARLADAYARSGNFDEAVNYYRQAERGLAKLRPKGKKLEPEWLPQTLFWMGSISARTAGWVDFESVLRPLARSQIYLLEAAELGRAPWAERAQKDLTATYAQLWSVIENPPAATASDPVLDQRRLRDIQLARAELLSETLRELSARALATEPSQGSAQSRAILEYTKMLDQQIAKLFGERPFGEGPTPESAARRKQGSSRLQTFSTDTTLEKKFLESAKDPNL